MVLIILPSMIINVFCVLSQGVKCTEPQFCLLFCMYVKFGISH